MDEYVLEMLNITKEFPGVKALDSVTLKVRPGSVHGLVGENGAGKSTLSNCLLGILKPTSGEIKFKGEPANFTSIKNALEGGLSMIHQELTPIPDMSVSQNIWLGREPMNGLFVDDKTMHKNTLELLNQIGMDLDPRSRMGSLTVAQQQMVEIAKAISYDSSLIVMDEPTSSLTESESKRLLEIITDLKNNGVSVIYISHKLDEVFDITDEITVIRDGQYITTEKTEDLNTEQLIKLMVGRDMSDMYPELTAEIGEVVLEVKNLSVEGIVDNVSFTLREGEILGMSGLIGAGRTDLVEAIFGLRKITNGEIFLRGQKVEINSSQDAINHGIALLTEDRRETGIVGELSVKDNITIANLPHYGSFLNEKELRRDAQNYVEKLNVKTPTIGALIKNLSGGNQQKALIGKWLLTDPDILIIDEPTRGIDVGAKAEIYSLINLLAEQGKSVIMVSSELVEIIGMSNRVLIMSEGKKMAILNREDATQEKIMEYATGNVDIDESQETVEI